MAFTIKELESLSGIKAHTIRIWEQRYHFLRPSRTHTNIRTYTNEELKTLLTVALLNRYGYKISRIDAMGPEQRELAALTLSLPAARHEGAVNELIGYTIDLKNFEFEECLDRYIQQYGMEQCITTLIFGFLEKVGLLWQTNRIVPVQEHIVSCIIRQKIVSAIEALPPARHPQPLFLLFLPEDEHHEMGLLFVYFLLRKKGIPVIYLGANVPLNDVGYLVTVKPPSYLYLHLTAFPRRQNFQKFLQHLAGACATSRILISGSSLSGYKRPLPANVRLMQSLEEVKTFISGLADPFV